MHKVKIHHLIKQEQPQVRDGSTADEVGAAAPPFETDFMLLSSDFSLKYCIFIVTAPPFCLTAPTFKNSWIRHCHKSTHRMQKL
jgi:hypothetical protein